MAIKADMREKHVLVYITKTPGSKPEVHLVTTEDAKKIMAGRSKKITPEMVEDINWEPTIGQIRYAQSRGAKLHTEPGKEPKVTCTKCGKKFEEYRSIGDQFVQEMALGGPGTAACESCAEKMGI